MDQITLECLEKANPESMRKLIGGEFMDAVAEKNVPFLLLRAAQNQLWTKPRRRFVNVAISVTYAVNPDLKPRILMS
jgi:hypothetical protein